MFDPQVLWKRRGRVGGQYLKIRKSRTNLRFLVLLKKTRSSGSSEPSFLQGSCGRPPTPRASHVTHCCSPLGLPYLSLHPPSPEKPCTLVRFSPGLGKLCPFLSLIRSLIVRHCTRLWGASGERGRELGARAARRDHIGLMVEGGQGTTSTRD